MPAQHTRTDLKTAVLVVHGMGIHRPLEMLRGIIDAVWRDGPGGKDHLSHKRIWFHPERNAIDIDLPVISANAVPEQAYPKIDFHEFYWSHLMSETRAVAVLLWLFELARKGPWVNPTISPLWWGTAIIFSFLILSVAYLGIQGLEWAAGYDPGTQFAVALKDAERQRQVLLVAPIGVIAIVTTVATCFFLWQRAQKLAGAAIIIAIVAMLILCGLNYLPSLLINITVYALPSIIAFCAIWLLMGQWGLVAYAIAIGLSLIFFSSLLLVEQFELFGITAAPSYPWSLDSQWGTVLAWFNIAFYLALTVLFLQPYLGDAARYFRNAPANVAVRREIRRQAVETLEKLHTVGKYDRIIVIAHSLGSVIAYDMLRTYFARIAHELPTGSEIFDDEFNTLDSNKGKVDLTVFRNNARALVRKVAHVAAAGEHQDAQDAPKTWLVTDFVTLGSPLTHAYYLMCDGNSKKELRDDFNRRVRERELPRCPPEVVDHNRRYTYDKPGTSTRLFHHGAMFGFTRWTNLYYPPSNLFWGDAIGGPVAPVFGDCVRDVEISMCQSLIEDFFCHVAYWDVGRPGGHGAANIMALHDAINLDDQLEPRKQT